MPDFMLLMHDDAPSPAASNDWEAYFSGLRASGCFQGGSAIGAGVCLRKASPAPQPTPRLTGYIRIAADNLDHARTFVAGNPVYESGGTVEIRALPKTG